MVLQNKDSVLQGTVYNRHEKFPEIPSSSMTAPSNID